MVGSVVRRVAAVVVASLAVFGLPVSAGAVNGVPAGSAVPVSCPDVSGQYNFGGLDEQDRFVSVWLPAGATLTLHASGIVQTAFWHGEFSVEYVLRGYATGGQFGETEAEVGWGVVNVWTPDVQWTTFAGTNVGPMGGFQNITSSGAMFRIRLFAGVGRGNGIHWSLTGVVTGGDGSAAPECASRLPEGIERGYGGAGRLHVGDPVDTGSGNLFDGFTDLAATASLPGLELQRAYNSTDPGTREMGQGWTAPYGARAREFGGYADVMLDDGRVVRFRASGSGFARPQEALAGLSRDDDGSLRLSFNGGVVWEFDVAGRLERTTDPSGVSAVVVRDGSGRVSTVTSSAGVAGAQPSLAFWYRPDGLLGSVVASDARSVHYGYDGGRLTSFTDAASEVWRYEYDLSGRLTKVVDPTDVVQMSSTYDALGRVVWQSTPEGGPETFAYDAATRTTTHTVVSTGEVLKYVHDAEGRVVSIVDPNSKTNSRRVGALGFWDQETSRANVVSGNVRDARGNVTSVSDPASGPVSATYDSRDRPLSVTDPGSGTTRFDYSGSGTSEVPSKETDALGKSLNRTITDGLVISETDADGVTTSFTYFPNRLVESRSVAGATTWFTYWPQGWLKTQRSPEGRVTSYEYDGAGRVKKVTSPGNVAGTVEVTSYEYDGAGRLLTVTDPTLAVTTRSYDPVSGLLVAESKPGKPATTYGYDALGQLIKVTDPSGVFTETQYGVLGRVVWTKDSAGRRTDYSYRDDGQLASVAAPDSGVTKYEYDGAGRVWKVSDPLERVTETTYDSAGRVWKVRAPDGGVTETRYDAVGRVWKVIDPTGRETTTTYTDAGRTASVTDGANVKVASSYDTSGRLWKSADLLGNTTVTTYWPDGLVKAVAAPSNLATNFTYNPAGRLSTVTDPAGVVTTSLWSSRGEKVSEQVSGRGAVTFGFNPDGTLAWSKDGRAVQTSYSYDAAGRRVGRATPVGVEAWNYTAGELVSYVAPAVNGQARVTSYGRDGAGRVNVTADPSGRTMTDTFNTAGELKLRTFAHGASSFSYSYGYDLAGRPTTVGTPDGTYVTGYDAAGRVTGVTPPDGRFVTYG